MATLEQRLDERMKDIEELQNQVKKGRDTLQGALTSKEELQKKALASQKHASETRKLTADDLVDLEQVRTVVVCQNLTFYVNLIRDLCKIKLTLLLFTCLCVCFIYSAMRRYSQWKRSWYG